MKNSSAPDEPTVFATDSDGSEKIYARHAGVVSDKLDILKVAGNDDWRPLIKEIIRSRT